MRSLFFLLTICFSVGLSGQEKKIIDQVVAVVGNSMIMESDIESQRIQLQAQGYFSQGDIKCEILEQMLYQKLLVHQAAIDSVEVTDRDVEMELDRKISYFVSQIGSEEKLEEYFKKSMAEIKEDFKETLREQMLAHKMHSQLTGDIKITPTEVRKYFKSLHPDSIPLIPAEYEIQQIVKYPVIEENEILLVKEKLRQLRDRIVAGENFATLAILYSEDPGSAKNGGELGFVGRGDLVPEFAAVAFNLKPGEVSKIVKTDYGFHIIQLIERKGEKINVRHILLTPKVNPKKVTEAKRSLDTLASLIKADSIKFDIAAARYSQDKDTRLNGGLLINPATGNTRFEASHIESSVAFAIKNLQVGQISEPFESKDEQGRTIVKIVCLKSKSETHLANLQTDYQRIQDNALEQKKSKFIKDWIEKKKKTTYIRIIPEYSNCIKFN